MRKEFLVTEEDIANMIKKHEARAREMGLAPSGISAYRYDSTLKELHGRYLKFRDTSLRPVYLHATLKRVPGLEEDIQLEITGFDEIVTLFKCSGRLIGEYSDYLVSMYTIIPDSKSELAKEALRRCE